MSVVRLILVDVEDLTSPGQLFRCLPYKATILARACVDRQGIAVRQTTQDLRKPTGDRISGDYDKCLKCTLGPRVALQLALAEQDPDPAQQDEEKSV